jgi:WhiB family redox-sensing transcriptional regulator
MPAVFGARNPHALIPAPIEAEAFFDRARCRLDDVEVEVMFPTEASKTAKAKMICRQCEVRRECLYYAVTYNLTGGVWGGVDETQRRKAVRHDLVELNHNTRTAKLRARR